MTKVAARVRMAYLSRKPRLRIRWNPKRGRHGAWEAYWQHWRNGRGWRVSPLPHIVTRTLPGMWKAVERRERQRALAVVRRWRRHGWHWARVR